MQGYKVSYEQEILKLINVAQCNLTVAKLSAGYSYSLAWLDRFFSTL